MRLDIGRYGVHRHSILVQYEKHKDSGKSLGQIIASCAAHGGCPNTVLCFFLAEKTGFTPDLMKVIDRLIKFNGYDEVLNQPEGSPYAKNSV